MLHTLNCTPTGWSHLQADAGPCNCQVVLDMLQQRCLQGLVLLCCGGTLDQLQGGTGRRMHTRAFGER
jgi:hypothetical protein